MQEEAIEIAATQTKSACADWFITGVANPDLVSHAGVSDKLVTHLNWEWVASKMLALYCLFPIPYDTPSEVEVLPLHTARLLAAAPTYCKRRDPAGH